jgi:hypothetical protein
VWDFGQVCKISKSSSCVCNVCLSVCLSLWNNSAPTGQIFIKCDVCEFFVIFSRKIKFHENLTIIMAAVHEELYCTVIIIRHSALPRLRNVSDKSCTEI